MKKRIKVTYIIYQNIDSILRTVVRIKIILNYKIDFVEK